MTGEKIMRCLSKSFVMFSIISSFIFLPFCLPCRATSCILLYNFSGVARRAEGGLSPPNFRGQKREQIERKGQSDNLSSPRF